MGTLGSFVQKGALGTQGFAPSNVTGWLLQRAGVSLSPGQEAIRYGGKRAACCVSLDFDVTEDARAQPNHDGTHLLLYNAQRYGIPLTWAVCGMTVEKDPEPFEAVLKSGGQFEIASHTYAHLRVDTASQSELEADFEKWRSVVGESGPKTIVFPYNKAGNFDALRKLGFSVYRGKDRKIGSPTQEKGFCNISPVMYLSGRTEDAVKTARGFIDLCIRYRGVFHLWSHPWNLSREGDPKRYSESVVDPIFSYLREKSDEGALGLYTMGQLASEFTMAGQPN